MPPISEFVHLGPLISLATPSFTAGSIAAEPAAPAYPAAGTEVASVGMLAPPQAPLQQSILARSPAVHARELELLREESVHSFGMAATRATLLGGKKINELKAQVVREYGRRLRKEEARELYESTEALLQRLAAAFERLSPSRIEISHQFSIVESEKEDAFVFSLAGKSRGRRVNLIYVTTGLLRRLFGESEDASTQGFHRLAGVVAHEMAHPLDKLDSEGLSKRRFSYQAQEVRADVETVLMLRACGTA